MKQATPLPLLLVFAACGPSGPEADQGVTRLLSTLQGTALGVEQAGRSTSLEFPKDHASHPGFRTEWWYFTGNLTGSNRAPGDFGFQLTFFRNGLTPNPPKRSSELASSEAWMAHFALTDFAQRTTLHAERFARGAPGFAGPLSKEQPASLAVGNWQILGLSGLGPERRPTFRLIAEEPGFGLELLLTSTKALVPQGDRGYSRKGSGEFQASHYVSATRLAATGTVRIGEQHHPVEGSAWLDREWTSSLLGPEQVGWDWFAIQLEDGTDLMAYRMRLRNGDDDPTAHGSLTDPSGSSRTLAATDYQLTDVAFWESPESRITYPAGWTLTLPTEGLELTLEVPVSNCEIGDSYRYWEGPIQVHGTRSGLPVRGVGYAELVGYGGETTLSSP